MPEEKHWTEMTREEWVEHIREISPKGGMRLPILEGFLFTNISKGHFQLIGDVVYWVDGESDRRWIPQLDHPEWPIMTERSCSA